MKSGMVRHPYLGETKTYLSNQRQMMEIKFDVDKNSKWFDQYDHYRSFEWKYCLFPESVAEDNYEQFPNKVQHRAQVKKITYFGCYVTSLREEIETRSRNNAKFTDNEILYILYTALRAWREWRHFSDTYGHVNQQFTALSADNILLSMEGDIRVITPLSAPIQKQLLCYYAPENIAPAMEARSSWNKSITFSLGLIGAELIARKNLSSCYQTKGPETKFSFEAYLASVKSVSEGVSKQIYNIVMFLTERNPFIRLKLGEFEAVLKPYESEILDGRRQRLDPSQSRKALLDYLANKKQDSDK